MAHAHYVRRTSVAVMHTCTPRPETIPGFGWSCVSVRYSLHALRAANLTSLHHADKAGGRGWSGIGGVGVQPAARGSKRRRRGGRRPGGRKRGAPQNGIPQAVVEGGDARAGQVELRCIAAALIVGHLRGAPTARLPSFPALPPTHDQEF